MSFEAAIKISCKIWEYAPLNEHLRRLISLGDLSRSDKAIWPCSCDHDMPELDHQGQSLTLMIRLNISSSMILNFSDLLDFGQFLEYDTEFFYDLIILTWLSECQRADPEPGLGRTAV